MRKPPPSLSPKQDPSDRERRTSGVVQTRGVAQKNAPQHTTRIEVTDDFERDDPTDPHMLDPREYAKLSLGEGSYQWHEEDTDVSEVNDRSGERLKLALRETSQIRMSGTERHYPRASARLSSPDVAPRASGGRLDTLRPKAIESPAEHRDIDTQPKIRLPEQSEWVRDRSSMWRGAALGFVLGVVCTIATAWLLQNLG